MAELSGSLEGFGLGALVGFLSTVGQSGHLTIAEADMSGALDFDKGAVVGAVFEGEEGESALEAISLALPNGRFEFSSLGGAAQRNLDIPPEQVTQRLEQFKREHAALGGAIPSMASVPRLVVSEGPDDAEVALDRDSLRLLMRVDGRRTVAELARERGLLRTLRQLARLAQLRLVRVDPAEARVPTPLLAESDVERPRGQMPTPLPGTDTAARGAGARARPGETAWSRWRRPPEDSS